MASPVLLDILLHIANDTMIKGVLPDSFKIGSVYLVLKKLKPAKNPDNYRRITTTAIVGKIVEKQMIRYFQPIPDLNQSRLQFGFASGCSPIYAALVVSEVMAEAADHNQELLITLLSTSKAFDVVNHHSMLNALHFQGIEGNLWRIYDSMYRDIKSVVKSKGELSDPL